MKNKALNTSNRVVSLLEEDREKLKNGLEGDLYDSYRILIERDISEMKEIINSIREINI